MHRASAPVRASTRRLLSCSLSRPLSQHLRWFEAVPAPVTPSQIVLRKGAAQKLNSLQASKQDSVLKLMVNSGGCSGYSYDFSLVQKPEDSDVVVERDGARLAVDKVSLAFLEECEVDYVEEMIRASFQVVKNKLADSKCGCGSSFSVGF
uniref:Core domain-containing protein n=1 Tax=Noctiluca scintillans TaxID=2966 RepID=A0A7S0ZTQ4_NOCSC|mmetsp:Transcript_18276/g.49117  ORF Transcript_18276/g.49117 Transcript_18276/m.49117 type:complete len:150 (+) Transcript_18276:75-524(+)